MLDPELKLSSRGMTTTGYPEIYNTKVQIFWANFLISKLYSVIVNINTVKTTFNFDFYQSFKKCKQKTVNLQFFFVSLKIVSRKCFLRIKALLIKSCLHCIVCVANVLQL